MGWDTFKNFLFILCFTTCFLILPCEQSKAVEGGTGLYPLGYQGSLPGILPPPGLYFRNDFYYYNATTPITVLQGQVDANLDLNLFLDMLSFTYVPNLKLPGGGSYGFGLLIPLGYVHLKGTIIGDEQFGSRSADDGGYGDTYLTPILLGWHFGNYHLLFYTGVFFPTGPYTIERVVNLGKNHYAVEPGVNFTWFDPKRGHEASLATGYTVNFENTATNYTSGSEFHADFNYTYRWHTGLGVGAAGYFYQQMTGDSGSGTTLGSFKGTVLGLGPQITYSTKFGIHDFSLSGRYYREFLNENRFKGNTVFITATLKIL